MPAAAQLPIASGDAEKVGPRTFRKSVLKFGSLPYQGRTLTYDRAYGQRLVDNFRAGAFGQVPFVLVDADNRHSNDPERFRGEVKGLELTENGVDATVELTAEGAQIVEANPRLGVSPRIVEDAEHVPHLPAIQHVAGTFDPRGRDLGEWKRVADLAGVYDAGTVDLTSTLYMAETTPTTAAPLTAAELAALASADPAALRALLPEADPQPDPESSGARSTTPNPSSVRSSAPNPSATETETEGRPSLLDRLRGRGGSPSTTEAQAEAEPSGELSAEDQALIADLLGNDAPSPAREAEPVALSAEDRRTIELAGSRADAAEARAETVASAMRAEAIKHERVEAIRQGVPPAIFDLAAPFLGADAVVELSGGEKHDASAAMRQILEEHKGFLDMSGPAGSVVGLDDNEDRRKQAEAITEGWA